MREERADGLIDDATAATLQRVADRVLWLATTMIHHANHVRTTTSGVKVGGHQASSASMVSIMTALYLEALGPHDQVSVKPHAGPVLHAINHLLGDLDTRHLTELRAFGGLQSYPSRTKDPDRVDYSTGSVGIGATATIWRALSRRYLDSHGGGPSPGRQIALVGDAELDEGAVWEALVDPMVAQLGEVLWVIDLNRQSLDRIVPNIATPRMQSMFEAAGWHTITLKYGRRLRTAFTRPGGDALEARIDGMTNPEYQRLLRASRDEVRGRLLGERPDTALVRLLDDLDDAAIGTLVRDLGGHDLVDLVAAYREAAAVRDRPTVVFAYTIKARGLPTEGDPSNHSALLDAAQWEELAVALAADPADPWRAFDPAGPEAALCARAAARLRRPDPVPAPPPSPPAELARTHAGASSTQQTFGRLLGDLANAAPDVARRIVTVSPDVASSTNLGGWINRVGIWSAADRRDWFADDGRRLVKWTESTAGQHIELGIAEGNLVGLISELGATWSRDGEPLVPIGTIYDPFVTRALEQWSFGMYAGGQSILVGTPSGVTLAPEGGAHQSVITPSIGLEQPGCVAWEPAFGHDLEWTLLDAIGRIGRAGGASAYFRLSTRPIDQRLAAVPTGGDAREQRRRDVLAGGYVLRRAAGAPAVTLVAVGVVVPEVLDAADRLGADGLEADVVCLTSPDLVFRAGQARRGLADGDDAIVDRLFPPARRAPIVTVHDGHPHTLAFVPALAGVAGTSLGVAGFGQSGDVDDLYRAAGIDSPTIVGAAWDLVDAQGDGRREG